MDETGLIKNRKILPRWREVERMPSYEISSADNSVPHVKSTDDQLKFHHGVWLQNPTIENALEVICSAQMSSDRSLAYGAAEQILKQKNILPETTNLATIIRHGAVARRVDELFPVKDLDLFRAVNRQKIQQVKKRLSNEPANGLLWLEFSRLQAVLGNSAKAEYGIRNALAAAPNNRVVLRAGARFLIHQNQPDVAYEKLRRADSLKFDPWVQAAEIAVAGLINKTAISLKMGKSEIENQKFSAIHLSELSAAIGTEEIRNGNTKAGRKFFNSGLINPTENTVAQAFWAKNHIDIELSEAQLQVPRAFEANANSAFSKNDFLTATKNCINWCFDEPFSSSPAVQGTYIASAFLDDQESALQIYNFARETNPNDPRILNNGAVALSKLSRFEEASTILQQLEKLHGDNKDAVLEATKGLLQFRKKDIEGGRFLYGRAVSIARENGNSDVEFRAVMHWLLEEVEAKAMGTNQIMEIISRIDAFWQKRPKEVGTSCCGPVVIAAYSASNIFLSPVAIISAPSEKYTLKVMMFLLSEILSICFIAARGV